jgi:uncharacterized OB-fold protein
MQNMSKISMPAIRARPLTLAQDIPISKTAKFWDGLKEGKVYGTRCLKCGKLYFPPAADCSNCFSSEVEWVQLSSEVEIETYTRVVVRPTSFQDYKPYTVAVGRLKEGVRVLAWLTGFKLSETKVGLKARLIAKVAPDGNPTYEFVPFESQ